MNDAATSSVAASIAVAGDVQVVPAGQTTAVDPQRELAALLAFYEPHVIDAAGGFHWLDAGGLPLVGARRPLWLNARFTYSYALAELIGAPGASARVEHGLEFFDSSIRDRRFHGWFPDPEERATKEAYGQAHVVLATAAALRAGHTRARPMLERALQALFRFWEPRQQLFADVTSRDGLRVDPYRGANANMHATEALLAAGAVLRDPELTTAAVAVIDRILGFASPSGWRIPEHFDADWRPDPDYNRDNPRNAFRPYGITIGHSFEWSRLALQAWMATGARDDRLISWAAALFDRAASEGVQSGDRLIFSVDYDGKPLDTDRYHWPVAEAIGAAESLRSATSDHTFAEWSSRFWHIADRDFIDRERGGWIHQINEHGTVTASVWEGKPDLYHAMQACLYERLPLASDLATALSQA